MLTLSAALQYATKITWSCNDHIIIIFQSSFNWIYDSESNCVETLHKKWSFPVRISSVFLLKKSLMENLFFCPVKFTDHISWHYGLTSFEKLCGLKILTSSVSFILARIWLSPITYSNVQIFFIKGSFFMKGKRFSKITWSYINVIIISL